MSESKTVRVSILDKDYQVSCEESEVTALQRSAQFLDQKMREMKQNSNVFGLDRLCLLYTSPSPRDQRGSRMPSSA